LIAYAAIDVRQGRVVQLVGGRVEQEAITWPDPVAVAHNWVKQGFTALHVVDLDAALGIGSNRSVVEAIISQVKVPVQVGGGVRDETAVQGWIDAGASKVIVGTRAVEDAVWRRSVAEKHPHRIVVAADTRDGRVVTRGWQQATSQNVESLIKSLNDDVLGGLLVTDVSREGQMTGVNVELFTRLARVTRHPLIAAGGIRDAQDVHALARAGAAGAVLGMALYRGVIDAAEITAMYAT
jgi:phosphoribosylformimino-5-aminoimidazole carboxamide ribotide isomerase